MGFVKQDQCQILFGKQRMIAQEQRVTGKNHVGTGKHVLLALTIAPMPQRGIQVRRKPGNFGLPVGQNRSWAYDQHGRVQTACVFERGNVGQRLHGFAQPHVISKHSAEPCAVQRLQPIEALLLVGA